MGKGTKIAVVGAAGFVGSSAAYAIVLKNFAELVMLVDVDQNRVQGQANDLSDASVLSSTLVRSATPQEAGSTADIIVIAAGANQKPGESRLDLIGKNIKILNSVLDSMKPIRHDALMVIVANPCDILTYFAKKNSGLPNNQVFGSGTLLDTFRLRGGISQVLGVGQTSIHSYVLGEHGDSQVIPWSVARAGGASLDTFEQFTAETKKSLEDSTKGKAYQIIQQKGATFFGIGACVAYICHEISMNSKKIVTLSTNYKGVCMSVPVVLGAHGIIREWPLHLSEEEVAKLDESAKSLREIIQQNE